MSDTIITTNPRSRRQLQGTAFLAFEHTLRVTLVVAVTILLGTAIALAFQLWTGSSAEGGIVGLSGAAGGLAVGTAMTVAASLLVLLPVLLILEMRTRAEYKKRPGFEGRLAYKLPLYGAFAVLLALIVIAVIQMLAAFLTSLALLGTNGADIGDLYLSQFLPAMFALALYGAAGYYLFHAIKGRDRGLTFGLIAAVLAAILVLALFITSVVIAHEVPTPASTNRDGSIEDYFRDYNSRNDSF